MAWPNYDTPSISEIIWVRNVRAIVVCGFFMKSLKKHILKIWKKSWVPFGSYLLYSTANPVEFEWKWAGLVVLMYVCMYITLFLRQPNLSFIITFEKYMGRLADSIPTKEVQKFSSSPGIVSGLNSWDVHLDCLGVNSSGENVLISF